MRRVQITMQEWDDGRVFVLLDVRDPRAGEHLTDNAYCEERVERAVTLSEACDAALLWWEQGGMFAPPPWGEDWRPLSA